MKKSFNLAIIQNWVSAQGKQGRVNLAYKSGIGYDTIGRILRSDKQPSPMEVIALAKATKMKKSDLFT
jgi:hypothetical protein